MDFIKMLREDNVLSDLLHDVCDIEIFPKFKTPEDEFGHLAYNISGKTFAGEGSGSEYILLDLPEAQQELAGRMGIEIKTDVADLLMQFYYCAKREPRFVSTYTEDDGSAHSGTGSLFDR